jgi:hypothetical protein
MKVKSAGGVAQVVEHLLEVLGSEINPSTDKKKILKLSLN